ncbi:MAG: peptide chain release factor N(5)-glutamine methyltransferase [Muricoprocola sp.]
MTYEEALRRCRMSLENTGIDDPDSDAWGLFEFVTGMDRTHFFLENREEMKNEERKKLEELTALRCERVPLQQITGYQYFYGRRFSVNEHVLIPRQDTECLVEETLQKVKSGDRVLDLCTGSGCIAVTIAKEKRAAVVGADISAQALKIARKNAKDLEADVLFVEGDLFETVEGEFDCIVSNPPYIPAREIPHLMPEVREHEPVLALDGSEDGLFFYRKITHQAPEFLKPGGWLLFEIGYDQGISVPEIMKLAGFKNIEVKKDLAGHDRVVLGQRY